MLVASAHMAFPGLDSLISMADKLSHRGRHPWLTQPGLHMIWKGGSEHFLARKTVVQPAQDRPLLRTRYSFRGANILSSHSLDGGTEEACRLLQTAWEIDLLPETLTLHLLAFLKVEVLEGSRQSLTLIKDTGTKCIVRSHMSHIRRVREERDPTQWSFRLALITTRAPA